MMLRHRQFIVCFFLLLFFFSSTGNAQPLADTRICLDAGHGGHTSDDRQIFLPNGIVYWESEGDFTTSQHLKTMLEALGATVKLTRSDNSDASDISLSERAEIANTFNSDYFHSIHTNGGGGNYSLVLYKEENGEPAFPQAEQMSGFMAPNLQKLMKTEANYFQGDFSFLGFNLGVLKYVFMPATLSESSFHDLPEEGLRLTNSEYLKNYAWALCQSFLNYFEGAGFSSGRVGGIITDVTSSSVVNEVTVQCIPAGIEYTGDNNYNGFYAIGDLVPGNYTLNLSKSGYLDNSQNITISANEYLDLDLTIQYFNNGFPNLDFYVVGLPAGAGEWLTFNAEKSSDDGFIEEYRWDFGDGTGTETGVIVTHLFAADGNYEVTLTATDNEGNQSSITKPIHIITQNPSIPEGISVRYINEHKDLLINWKTNPESNLAGYHIYFSEKADFSDEILLSSLDPDQNQSKFDDFGEKDQLYFFRMKSENIANKFSDYSDVYSLYKSQNPADKPNVLIVNGFNRNASYTGLNHKFVSSYTLGLAKMQAHNISSCSNYAVISETVSSIDHDVVIWFLGDESTANETFNNAEQLRLKQFLESGRKLFVTGSEIAWDLVAKGTPEDLAFYNNYLKAEYWDDGANGLSPASGLPGSGFDSLTIHFGEVYPEDFPDEIGPFGGSSSILSYKNGANAGIKFKGTFGTSDKEGALVNIGFPLESTGSQTEIDAFITKLMAFFYPGSTSSNDIRKDSINFNLYPTMTLNQLDLYYEIPSSMNIQLEIYTLNGQKIYHLNDALETGTGHISIPTAELEKGNYILKVSSNTILKSMRFVRL